VLVTHLNLANLGKALAGLDWPEEQNIESYGDWLELDGRNSDLGLGLSGQCHTGDNP